MNERQTLPQRAHSPAEKRLNEYSSSVPLSKYKYDNSRLKTFGDPQPALSVP